MFFGMTRTDVILSGRCVSSELKGRSTLAGEIIGRRATDMGMIVGTCAVLVSGLAKR